jgi:selenium-binding protein 1
MPLMTPDPTFYPSPKMAAQSPPEKLAYLALINPLTDGCADAIGVVDLDPGSSGYGRLVGQTDMPHAGDELHHFGWNACSSCLCPYAAHPHMERRYLIVPGINSSRIHILDTKPDPRQPRIVKVIEPETIAQRTGYAAPHTVHCGPDGIFVSALGAPDGNGPGGTFLMDPETFDVRGRWEIDRGPQELMYDIWWHLGLDTMVSSTWGTPNMVKDGVNPELLLGGKYGSTLHVWDLRSRRHLQELKLGDEQQMALELRPAHDPTRAYGFVGVVLSLKDLSSSVWLWYRDTSRKTKGSGGPWAIKKVIEIPAEPADPKDLPPFLQGFKAAAPLVTEISLSVDDRHLFVSCWGTGEFIHYDVSDPFNPRKVSSFRLGGMVARAAHPGRPDRPLNGGPQMIEVSRDGRRLYITNSLYTPWDKQFYPDGVHGWMAKVDLRPGDGMELDRNFFLDTGSMRPHQLRLEGGDASSDSYCYAS